MMAETRYLTSQFMGGAKADDIMKTFDDAVTKKIGQAECKSPFSQELR